MIKKISDRFETFLLVLILVSAVLAVFGGVCKNEFINLDDPDYVTANEHVQKGLTHESIRWAFTTYDASNWHPLTWLSLMLDYQLLGPSAGGFHLTNLLFHTANTVLLFFVLWKMTGYFWRSWFVALLFGIHPLHVESVAWVAERKDVLSTLFWFLTMYAYCWYVQRGGWLRYLLTIFVFGLGLMAKPMLVTLPFVLLLVDYWPFRRFEFFSGVGGSGRQIGRLVIEKIPLFVLSGVSIYITLVAQRIGGAVISFKKLDIWWRVSNAIVSYAIYILKTFVPVRLAVFYPNMSPPGLAEMVGAVLLLVWISIAVALGARRRGYLVTGWLWYLGTLVPVLGLVQVGAQAYADRYTYVPLIGLFIIIGWLVPDILSGWRYKRIAIGLGMCAVAAAMGVVTTKQVRHWRDTVRLFEHTASVTKDNCVAHNCLANGYGELGQYDKCIEHGLEAIRFFPRYDAAHYNLGMGYYNKGELENAIEHWQEALRLKPDYKEANFNIGVTYVILGEYKKAIEYFEKELAVNAEHKRARENREALLAKYPQLWRRI